MELVSYEIRDHVGWITMNRPEKLNAINGQMREELFEAFEDAERNNDVWVAVVTGTGRAFSVGHDLVAMAGRKVPGGDGKDRTTDDLYLFISQLYKPVVAAINGICMAQGGGLALLSDIRIAVEGATFAWPQVKRGISSMSGPTLLAKQLPLNLAMQILMTGEPLSAQDALRYNLVNEVVPADQLMVRTEALARQICANAPLAVRAIKEASLVGMGMTLEEHLKAARQISNRVEVSNDAKEGLLAFKEKRAPTWTAS
jgi:enoyl-CoA hydratase/carnithine racemase